MEDDAIRDLVRRLSRPDALGGHTVERAVLVAEGKQLPEIVTWILAHGGVPETPPAVASTSGLHGPRVSTAPARASVPQRYVLPAGALA